MVEDLEVQVSPFVRRGPDDVEVPEGEVLLLPGVGLYHGEEVLAEGVDVLEVGREELVLLKGQVIFQERDLPGVLGILLRRLVPEAVIPADPNRQGLRKGGDGGSLPCRAVLRRVELRPEEDVYQEREAEEGRQGGGAPPPFPGAALSLRFPGGGLGRRLLGVHGLPGVPGDVQGL